MSIFDSVIRKKDSKIVQVMEDIKGSQIVLKNTKTKAEKLETYTERLKCLGMSNAAKIAEREKDLYLKEVTIATHGYRKIPFEKVKEYESQLPYNHIITTHAINRYPGSPPKEVLRKLDTAQKRNVFNDFGILTVEEKKEEKKNKIVEADPILVGLINESNDFYFIAEWGNDISIEQILGEKKVIKE